MIAIIDYGMGNLRSVENALRRLGAEFELTADPRRLQQADRVLLPGVGHAGEAFDVEHVATGVGDSLSEEALGVGAEGLGYFLVRRLGVDEGALYAQLLHGHSEEVVSASIDGVRRDEVVAGLADVKHGVEGGCLAAGGKHGGHTAFERCYFGGHGVVGGVLQASIEVALVLQVEETGHLLAIIILKGSALVDRQDARLTLLGLPAALHTDCGRFHCLRLKV